MRLSNNLERDLGTNEAVCPAKPDSTFADRALVRYMPDRYTAFKKQPATKIRRERRDDIRFRAAARIRA
jgi:hypothetical protein